MKLFHSLVAFSLAVSLNLAHALEIQPYSPELLASEQKADKSVALHFHADWCPTCRLQQKTIAMLQEEPGLDGSTILKVDYDRDQALRRIGDVDRQRQRAGRRPYAAHRGSRPRGSG